MNVNKKVQKKRVMTRKNMTLKLFKNILKNQISNKKKKIADFIVDNSGPKVKTRKILNKVLEEILK